MSWTESVCLGKRYSGRSSCGFDDPIKDRLHVGRPLGRHAGKRIPRRIMAEALEIYRTATHHVQDEWERDHSDEKAGYGNCGQETKKYRWK